MITKAFFYTAQDARRALNALQAAGAEVSDPQRLQQPQDGRQWALEIEMRSGSSTTRHPSPVLVDQVFEIILKNNGLTSQVG